MRLTTLNRERLAPSVRMSNSGRWESIDYHTDITQQAVPPSASETAYAVADLVRKILYSLDLHNSERTAHGLYQVALMVGYPCNIAMRFRGEPPLTDELLQAIEDEVDIEVIDWLLEYTTRGDTKSKTELRKRLVMLLWMLDYQHTTTRSAMARAFGVNYTDMNLILKEL